VARLLAMCDAVGATEDARTLLVLGTVGEGAGIEFLSWFANMDLPNPEDVLADPDGFELPERSDRAFAVLTGTTMPAILTEISFVSSPADEHNLQSEAYRQQIAEALYKGISRYEQTAGHPKVAQLQQTSAHQ